MDTSNRNEQCRKILTLLHKIAPQILELENKTRWHAQRVDTIKVDANELVRVLGELHLVDTSVLYDVIFDDAGLPENVAELLPTPITSSVAHVPTVFPVVPVPVKTQGLLGTSSRGASLFAMDGFVTTDPRRTNNERWIPTSKIVTPLDKQNYIEVDGVWLFEPDQADLREYVMNHP